MALAIVLLTGAGLLIRSYSRIGRVDPGVASHELLTMRLSLPKIRYAGPPQITDGYDRLVEAVNRVPGVVRASAVSSLPLGGGGFYLGRVFLREGQAEPPATADTAGAWSVVRPEYFATAGIPVVEGRAFTVDDAANVHAGDHHQPLDGEGHVPGRSRRRPANPLVAGREPVPRDRRRGE